MYPTFGHDPDTCFVAGCCQSSNTSEVEPTSVPHLHTYRLYKVFDLYYYCCICRHMIFHRLSSLNYVCTALITFSPGCREKDIVLCSPDTKYTVYPTLNFMSMLMHVGPFFLWPIV